jgi:hypothetical protein
MSGSIGEMLRKARRLSKGFHAGTISVSKDVPSGEQGLKSWGWMQNPLRFNQLKHSFIPMKPEGGCTVPLNLSVE